MMISTKRAEFNEKFCCNYINCFFLYYLPSNAIHQLELAFVGPIEDVNSAVPNQASFTAKEAIILEPNDNSLKNLQFIMQKSPSQVLGYGNWKISLSDREQQNFTLETDELSQGLLTRLKLSMKNGRYIDLGLMAFATDPMKPVFIHHVRRAKVNQIQLIDTITLFLLHMS